MIEKKMFALKRVAACYVLLISFGLSRQVLANNSSELMTDPSNVENGIDLTDDSVYSSGNDSVYSNGNDSESFENSTFPSAEMVEDESSTFPPSTEMVEDENATATTPDPTIELCREANCVRKCCPLGEYLNARVRCVPLRDDLLDWVPPETSHFHAIYGFPSISNKNSTCLLYNLTETKLVRDGRLLHIHTGEKVITDDYCIDQRKNRYNGTYVEAVLCLTPSYLRENIETVVRILIAASCVFLFILIVAHILNQNLRQKMHEKCFMSMCIALLLSNVSLLIIRLDIVNDLSDGVCVAIGFIVQYFSLAFNFWLNIRCYETFRIIRGTVKAIPISLLNSSKKRFLKYSLYCWGGPITITIFTLIMQFLPRGYLENARPHIGAESCWLRGDILILGLYYYVYQVILHVLNVLYLGMSIHLLLKTGELTCCWKSKASREGEIKAFNRKSLAVFWQQFFIFLFFIVAFSMDTITLINRDSYIWELVDAINAMQGIFILVIFLLSSKGRRKYLVIAYTATWNLVSSIFSKLAKMNISSRSDNIATAPATATSTEVEVTSEGHSLETADGGGKSNDAYITETSSCSKTA